MMYKWLYFCFVILFSTAVLGCRGFSDLRDGDLMRKRTNEYNHTNIQIYIYFDDQWYEIHDSLEKR